MKWTSPNSWFLIIFGVYIMNDFLKESAIGLDQIQNVDQLWQAVIKCRLHDNPPIPISDVLAMEQIYDQLSPSLTVQDMANVFSGVYIDSYWQDDGQHPEVMAHHLTEALGIPYATTLTYARNAMRQWRGVLCRKNKYDTGIVPQAVYTDSLDIVCNQDVPLTPQQLISQWESEFYKTPKVGKNYIYTRCQNRAFNGKISHAKVQMFYADGGFNQPPSSWVQCRTVDGGKQQGEVLNERGGLALLTMGDRGVSEGFILDLRTPQHVCMVSTVSYPFFSKNNPLTYTTGNWNSAQWIQYNGAMAWRNVDPQLKSGDESLVFHNQDATPEQFSFVLKCRRVPPGSKLRMYSEDPAAIFDSGLVNVVNNFQELHVSTIAPPHYAGHLKLHLEGPDGKLLPSDAAVDISMLWCVPHSHPHYLQAVTLLGAAHAVPALQSVHMPLGNFTLLGAGE
ncbi:hypothetical protein ABGV49_07240 [Chromobacterium vaccinii]|uniref:Uncharacterized protein n=1 Tax=Chromobacterium vaccinii TaxID=1108595 RepID=A0ABV0F9T8_9NEIS